MPQFKIRYPVSTHKVRYRKDLDIYNILFQQQEMNVYFGFLFRFLLYKRELVALLKMLEKQESTLSVFKKPGVKFLENEKSLRYQ